MTTPVRHAAHNVLTEVDSNRYDLATALDRARQRLKDSREGRVGPGERQEERHQTDGVWSSRVQEF